MPTTDRKYPCPDCRQCQWCSDERCRLCLKSSSACRKKLSMAEQIALFERLNSSDAGDDSLPPPGRDNGFSLENCLKTLK